jgi:hypothetical protein
MKEVGLTGTNDGLFYTVCTTKAATKLSCEFCPVQAMSPRTEKKKVSSQAQSSSLLKLLNLTISLSLFSFLEVYASIFIQLHACIHP